LYVRDYIAHQVPPYFFQLAAFGALMYVILSDILIRKSYQQVSAVLWSDEHLEAVTITVDSADGSSRPAVIVEKFSANHE
jgi:hypothetical protein